MSSAPVERVMEDDRVGRPDSGRFKPTINKSRLAQVPNWRSVASLEPSDELKKRAESGDDAAIDECLKLRKLKKVFEEGCRSAKPTQREHTYKGEKGYLYIPVWTMRSHYIDDEGRFVCKTDQFRAEGLISAEEQGPCCEHAGKYGEELTSTVVLVYETDHKGNVLTVEPELQRKLADGTRITFNYEFMAYSVNFKKINDWKAVQLANPPLTSDYLMWKKGDDKFAETAYSPTGDSLYQSISPLMIDRILDQAAVVRMNLINNEFGRSLTYDEMVARWQNGPSAVGTGSKKATREDARKFIR